MSRLPFVASTFFKTLTVVVILVIIGWVVAKKVFDYGPLQPQDWVGTVISTILVAYLVHLWLLPMPEHYYDDEAREDSEKRS